MNHRPDQMLLEGPATSFKEFSVILGLLGHY